jgi:kynurenine 3-monooxygenase
MKNDITIVGSGLTGPLLSTILSKNTNLQINVFERAGDPRKLNNFSGRSINLALSKRGIDALKFAGVYDDNFESLLIPMHGRSIHSIDGDVTFQPYGNKKEHYINSVSRLSINQTLMNFSEKRGNVNINFNMKCQKADLINGKLHFENKIFDIDSPVIGADGYRSIVSQNISEISNSELEYINIEHSYKELTIEPKNGEYQMEPNALHIWPRRDMMMIALPNLDRSFTCTLFMKSKGENINDSKKLYNFFETNFNDSIELISNLEYDFFNNPTGQLIGLRVPDWSYKDKGLIIGDAAHATVPFYGQGMNASFEDCHIFGQLLNEQSEYNWGELFTEFSANRKKDADAILDLSLDNYRIMRNDVLNETHIKKQKLAFILNSDFPDYFIPLYTMVSFTTIPYATALKRKDTRYDIE